MEKLIANAMEIDDSGAQDVEQQIQSNEEQSPMNVLDLPRELLVEILTHLDDDKQLLAASHVCKLFASVIETVFERKYSDKLYDVYNKGRTGMAFHKVILEKYGDKIREISIRSEDECLLDLVEEKCCNLKTLSLNEVPKIIMLKNLKNAYLTGIRHLTREQFTEFINKNRQIEDLELDDIEIDLIDLLDGRLNELETLMFYRKTNFSTHPQRIELVSLETLFLDLKSTEDYVCFLKAMDGNPITELNLYNEDGDGDNIINEICSFGTLTSLRLEYYTITKDQIKKMAQHLPDLTELRIKSTESGSKLEQIIHFILSMFPQLTELAIELDKKSAKRFSSQSNKSIYEFHDRLAGTNTEIFINAQRGNIAFFSKDYLITRCWSSLLEELHWMGNLSNENVRKVIQGFGCTRFYGLKFVNNCAGSAFDVSTLLSNKMDELRCLEIKSKGPITIDTKVSRRLDFLPHLETLKIHLEHHSVSDFIQKADQSFCKHIEELWLDTDRSAEDEDEDMEHANEITSHFAKFKNLTSLRLTPSTLKLDACYLFKVCQKLIGIKRIEH